MNYGNQCGASTERTEGHGSSAHGLTAKNAKLAKNTPVIPFAPFAFFAVNTVLFSVYFRVFRGQSLAHL